MIALFVGKENYGDLVELANLRRQRDGEAQCLAGRGSADGEWAGQVGCDRLLAKVELIVGLSSIGEQDRDIDLAGAVVAVQDANLNFAATG